MHLTIDRPLEEAAAVPSPLAEGHVLRETPPLAPFDVDPEVEIFWHEGRPAIHLPSGFNASSGRFRLQISRASCNAAPSRVPPPPFGTPEWEAWRDSFLIAAGCDPHAEGFWEEFQQEMDEFDKTLKEARDADRRGLYAGHECVQCAHEGE